MIQTPVSELEILWSARRVLADEYLTPEEKLGFFNDLLPSVAPEGMDFYSPNISKFTRGYIQDQIDELGKSLPKSRPVDGGSSKGALEGADYQEAAPTDTKEPDVRKAKGSPR